MIAIFSFAPKFCPACGKKSIGSRTERHATQDFFAGAAHECDCGLHYAYAPGPAILEAASMHGDIGRYVTAGDVAG